MNASSLHIYCPSHLQWQPTKQQFLELVNHFPCLGYRVVSVEVPVEKEPLDYKYVSFEKNVRLEQYIEYYGKSRKYLVVYMLNIPQWEQSLDSQMNSIDSLIKGNWVPWSLSICIGRHFLPDSYYQEVIYECRFCITIGGDGMPDDLAKCRDAICDTTSVKEIFEKLEQLNSKKWEAYISCSI